MQALTNRAKAVERKPMNWLEKLYLPAIFKGMAITFSHMFKKTPTIRYPDETRPFSKVFRGVHVLNRDEEGRERCTACGLCAVACPCRSHYNGSSRAPKRRRKFIREEKYAAKYEINMLRCIFCGLCEEACPKDAIYLTETFAQSNYQRKGFIYGKDVLLIPDANKEPEAYAKAVGAEAPTTK